MTSKTSAGGFNGFPAEGLKFLRDLERNNNRQWFATHALDCERHVLEPASAFVVALGTAFGRIHPGLIFDPRMNGSGSMFRLARDTRFAKDKTPYKTNLGLRFWLSEPARAAKRIGLYVHLDKAGVRVYGGGHALSAADLAAFRAFLQDRRNGTDLRRAIDDLTRRGYGFEAERLARLPAGIAGDHPNADLLLYKSLFAMSPAIPAATALTSGVVGECVARARELKPINDRFSRSLG